MEENKNLLLKGAMTYGLAMGIYWVVKYIFFIFSVSVPSLSLVYWLLTLAVPFIAYYMTKRSSRLNTLSFISSSPRLISWQMRSGN